MLVTLLSAFSAVIGHDVKVAHGKTQPVAFWPVLVGPTGKGRKGTAHGAAMQALSVAYSGFMETQLVEGCPRTGEGLVATLADKAVGETGTPVFLVEEEGDNLIDAAKRSKSLGVQFRKLWDGSTVSNRTKTETIVVKRPHMAMVMHVQPKNWGAISGTKDATGGTYNRFFPVYVERSKRVRLSQARTPSEVVVPLARELRDMAAYAMNVSEVTMPADVEDVFEAKHRPVVEALTLGTEALAQYAERALAYMLRLSALYALAEKRDQINVRDLDAATALVTYMVDTVTHVLPDAQSANGDLPVRVANWIREAGDNGRTSSEILRRYGIKREELDLIVAGNPRLKVGKGAYTGGRRAEVFRYVADAVFPTKEDTTEGATGEITVEDLKAVMYGSASADQVTEVTGNGVASHAMPYGTTDVRETGDVQDPRPEEDTTPVPSAVDALRALLDGPQDDPEPVKVETPEPAPAVKGVDALRAMLDGPQEAPEPTPIEEDEEDDDLSDLIALCKWANINV